MKQQGVEEFLEVDLLIVSCGIRPRDELARGCGLELGEKGGVKVEPLHLKIVFERVLAGFEAVKRVFLVGF